MGCMMYWAIFCSHPAALQLFSSLRNIRKDLPALRYISSKGVETKMEVWERQKGGTDWESE